MFITINREAEGAFELPGTTTKELLNTTVTLYDPNDVFMQGYHTLLDQNNWVVYECYPQTGKHTQRDEVNDDWEGDGIYNVVDELNLLPESKLVITSLIRYYKGSELSFSVFYTTMFTLREDNIVKCDTSEIESVFNGPVNGTYFDHLQICLSACKSFQLTNDIRYMPDECNYQASIKKYCFRDNHHSDMNLPFN